MLDMYKGMVNSPETTITNDINAEDTIIYVLDETKVPEELPNLMTLGTGTSAETVKVLEVNGNALTVERGFQGTPRSWNAGTVIARNFTEYDYNALKVNIETLDREIGDIDSLSTDEKANIVAAINETYQALLTHQQNTNQEIGQVASDLAAHKAENVHKQRTATVIVATYNSKQSSKDGADYICSETDAQEVINQAIQDIADTGGKIILMEGIYNISSRININVSNVTLEGMGQSTVIDANETRANCISCENVENVTIKSITFKNTGGAYNCMYFSNVTNCVVADCKLVNNGGNGISMVQAIESTVRNCISDSNGLSGIRLEECINCKIANNICRKNFLCGILITNSSYCRIADNILIDNTYQNSNPENNYGHIGMYVGDGQSNDNNYIVGNICRGQAHRGIAVRGSNNIVIHNDLRGSGTIELQDGGTNTITELAGNAISL